MPTVLGAGPSQHDTERSPLRDPNPAESPLQLSRRHVPPDLGSVPGSSARPGSCGPVSANPHSPGSGKLLRSPIKPQPVSSHPIESFDDSSASPSSDARGPPPAGYSDSNHAASLQQAPQRPENYHQRSMFASRDDADPPVHGGGASIPVSRDAESGASPGAMLIAQHASVVMEPLLHAVPEASSTQEIPPAKARRRTPPALSSRSLVAPPSQMPSSPPPEHVDTGVPCRLPDTVQGYQDLGQVMPPAPSVQQPCLQRADSDTSSLSQSQEQGAGCTAYAGLTGGGEPVLGREVQIGAECSPCDGAGPVFAANSPGPNVVVGAEDSRGSSISQKEELLQFLGNLSDKFELAVDVKAISPNVCFLAKCSL